MSAVAGVAAAKAGQARELGQLVTSEKLSLAARVEPRAGVGARMVAVATKLWRRPHPVVAAGVQDPPQEVVEVQRRGGQDPPKAAVEAQWWGGIDPPQIAAEVQQVRHQRGHWGGNLIIRAVRWPGFPQVRHLRA